MKKNLLILLIAMFMIVPFNVGAVTISGELVEDVTEDKTTEPGYVIKTITYSMPLTLTSDEEISLADYNLVLTFTIGKDVTFESYEAPDGFTATKSGNAITLTSTKDINLEAGQELGTYVFSYVNEDDIECDVEASLTATATGKDEEEEENPETGVSMPIVAIGTLGVIAVGLYVGTSKKNKIYNV